MSNAGRTLPRNLDDVEARAAEFLQRRRFWDWSDADEVELQLWLQESVGHRVAFLRLQVGAQGAERLVALRPPNKPGGTRDVGRGRRMRRLSFAVLGSLASVALITFAGFVVTRYFFQPTDRYFATDVGGRAQLKFADGTQMELNTDTAVRYRMTTEERTVWLEKGEAYFIVSHDATHPFRVVVGDRRITDLGTEFLVRGDNNHLLEVALVKGRADLGTEGSNVRGRTLTEGDDAVASTASFTIVKRTPQQIADELAWQRGFLVLRNARLADAILQFNRYNKTQLVITDPAVAELRIGGEFKTNNVEDFLQLAELVLKVHVERRGSEIVISRGDGRAQKFVGTKHKS